MLIIGDFNSPDIQWDYEDGEYIPSGFNRTTSEMLVNNIYYLELRQYKGVANNLGRILDLVLADDFDSFSVSSSSYCITPIDLYHPALEIFFH